MVIGPVLAVVQGFLILSTVIMITVRPGIVEAVIDLIVIVLVDAAIVQFGLVSN